MSLKALEEFRMAMAADAPGRRDAMELETRVLQGHEAAAEAAEAAAADEQRRVERQGVLDEIYRAFIDAEPPDADELGIDVAGLLPARAMLARFSAWLEKLNSDLADLEAQRVAFLKAQGVAASTEAEIKRLEEADRSGFLAWRKRGSSVMDKPALHAFEREFV